MAEFFTYYVFLRGRKGLRRRILHKFLRKFGCRYRNLRDRVCPGAYFVWGRDCGPEAGDGEKQVSAYDDVCIKVGPCVLDYGARVVVH